jgi:hypothetical protein
MIVIRKWLPERPEKFGVNEVNTCTDDPEVSYPKDKYANKFRLTDFWATVYFSVC